MISLEKLRQINKIVVHAWCPDGLGSAIILYDAFHVFGEPQPEVMFTTYNTDAYENLAAEPGLLFCDISPPKTRYQEFVEAGSIVLDHHKTAASVVKAFGENGVFGDEVEDPGVCGSVLAYREVWVPAITAILGESFIQHSPDAQFAKRFAYLAGVRDTWQTSSPDWETACALAEALRFYDPKSWLHGDAFSPDNKEWWATRQELGEILWAKHQDRIRSNINKAYRFTVGETRVLLFPGGSPVTSDTAELVGSDADLVVGFVFHGLESGQASLGFSTRSHTAFDCARFCKKLGGGGHTKAAGFSVKFDPSDGTMSNPYATFKTMLERHFDAEDSTTLG